jgi:hypothetical protein
MVAPTTPLHADFAGLTVTPGESHILAEHEAFDLVNVIAFGGAADRPSHVPAELGSVGPVVLWESTGASDALPFWNTNHQCDVYLYIVHGSVRMEFKETEGERRLGHYIGRTGDLMRLPKDIAHRTFSGDGRRRISLEILERNPHWAGIGTGGGAVDHSGTVGDLRFAADGDEVVVSWPDGRLRTPRGFFVRGLRALVAYELHLEHNEFEGGFVVHDHGDTVTLKAPGFAQTMPGADVLAVFRGLLEDLA